jgi:hypothetical protein
MERVEFMASVMNGGHLRSCLGLTLVVLSGACSPSVETCGNRTASVTDIATDRGLMFENSGLIGGDVILKDGQSCAAVLDIETKRTSENIGDSYQVVVFTSRHCDLLEKQKSVGGVASSAYTTDTLTLRVFGGGQYSNLDVTTLNPARRPPENSKSASEPFAAAYDIDFRGFIGEERQTCLGRSKKGTTCATLGDMLAFRALIGRAWGTALDSRLAKVFDDALTQRDKIRKAVQESKGREMRASEISRSIDELTLLRRDLRFGAPDRIDLGLVCLSAELRSGLKGNIMSADQRTALDAPLAGEDIHVREWREGILAAWRQMDPMILQRFCSSLDDDTTRWVRTELATAKITGEGQNPVDSSVLPLAYAAHLIARYVVISERMRQSWSEIGAWLASLDGRKNFWVASNMDLSHSQSPGKRFVTFSLGGVVLKNPQSTAFGSGIVFQNDENDHVTFKRGDSGSLFTFRGQFPLLVLYAVDGEEASGGVAVLPLPRGQTTSGSHSAGSVEDKNETNGRAGLSDGPKKDGAHAENGADGTTSGGMNGTSVLMKGGEPPASLAEAPSCR